MSIQSLSVYAVPVKLKCQATHCPLTNAKWMKIPIEYNRVKFIWLFLSLGYFKQQPSLTLGFRAFYRPISPMSLGLCPPMGESHKPPWTRVVMADEGFQDGDLTLFHLLLSEQSWTQKDFKQNQTSASPWNTSICKILAEAVLTSGMFR